MFEDIKICIYFIFSLEKRRLSKIYLKWTSGSHQVLKFKLCGLPLSIIHDIKIIVSFGQPIAAKSHFFCLCSLHCKKLKICIHKKCTWVWSADYVSENQEMYFDHEKNHKFLDKSIYFWLAFESYCFHSHACLKW